MTARSVPEDRAYEQFSSVTTEHEMTILHDDGLYRHLRCQKAGTYVYGFDVVTWPGYLTICGDIGTFTFSRLTDMFEFFKSDGARINPRYWAEKLCDGDLDSARRFSVDKWREHVQRAEIVELRDAFPLNEYEAYDLVQEHYPDAWEWDTREWTTRFLLCCHGIVWAIKKYRAIENWLG